MEVRIIKFDIDWLEIKNLCRTTVNMGDSTKEPTQEWKRKLLVSEHSPIRHGSILIEIVGIPYAISTHLVRHHIGVEKWVSTSREDRTGVPREERSQMDLVNMKIELNIQALINISKKRLCNQADPITRSIWEEVVKKVSEYDEDIAWACVPEGIHTCGCTEGFSNCSSCTNFLSTLTKEQLLDVRERLTQYQKVRKR